MEPDYQNNYQDELHLDDEVYEIKSDRINPEYLNNPPRRKRYSETNPKDMPVILIIILANFIAGVMCIIAGSDHFETGGLNYQYIHNNKEYIRLLTYMFLHANVPHFVNNMIALYIFGSRLEPVHFVLQLYTLAQELHQVLYLYMYHILSIQMLSVSQPEHQVQYSV